jgi:ADP-heptose:LPS heptosyltransferase
VPLVREVAAAMRRPAVDLAGRTSLWTLGALVERARLVVCNDTGISHVAAALGTESVVVSSGADVARWAPLDHARHALLWQPVPCRPCSFVHCPYGHECALAITPEQVIAAAHRTLFDGSRECLSEDCAS